MKRNKRNVLLIVLMVVLSAMCNPLMLYAASATPAVTKAPVPAKADAEDPFSDILANKKNKTESYGIVNMDTGGVGISNMVFVLKVIAVLGIMLTLLLVIGKYMLSFNGSNRQEIKNSVQHKVLIIIMLGCGVSLLGLIRSIAISMF